MAKPKVALAQVVGDSKDGRVSAAIVAALAGTELFVVTPKQVARAIKELGLSDKLTEKDIKKLEGKLAASAFVRGKLSKHGRNRTLAFEWFVHGKKQNGFSVSFTHLRSNKFKKTIRSAMVNIIGSATGDDDAVVIIEEAPEQKLKQKTGKDVAADTDKPSKNKRTKDVAADTDVAIADNDTPVQSTETAETELADAPTDDDRPKQNNINAGVAVAEADKPKHNTIPAHGAVADAATAHATPNHENHGDVAAEALAPRREVDGTADAEVSVATVARRAANRDAVRAEVGPSFQNRSLTFDSRSFVEGLGPPKPYKNSFFPGVRFEGEAYPFAFQNPGSALAGLGLAAAVDQTVSLKLRTSLQPGTELEATQRHYTVGVRYRYATTTTPMSPTVTVGIGYGRRTFTVDRSPLMKGIPLDLPDTDYQYFEPGVDIRVPLAGPVAIFVGGRAALITNAGAITSASEYGDATATGFLGDAGLDFVLHNRFAIRVTGELVQVGFKFTGAGVTKATNRDNDPTTHDVFGATDRSHRGAVTLAVLY